MFLRFFQYFCEILYAIFVHYIEHLVLLYYYSSMIPTDNLQIHKQNLFFVVFHFYNYVFYLFQIDRFPLL